MAPTRRFERISKRDDRLKYLSVIVVQIEYCTNFCGILSFDNLRMHYIVERRRIFLLIGAFG